MTYSYDAALRAERNRNKVYEIVILAVEKAAQEKGLSRKDIAEILGKKPPQISMWLSGPSNWTLDTISDLLFAVGAEMNYQVAFDDHQLKSNLYHYATISPALQSIEEMSTTSDSAISEEAEILEAYQ